MEPFLIYAVSKCFASRPMLLVLTDKFITVLDILAERIALQSRREAVRSITFDRRSWHLFRLTSEGGQTSVFYTDYLREILGAIGASSERCWRPPAQAAPQCATIGDNATSHHGLSFACRINDGSATGMVLLPAIATFQGQMINLSAQGAIDLEDHVGLATIEPTSHILVHVLRISGRRLFVEFDCEPASRSFLFVLTGLSVLYRLFVRQLQVGCADLKQL